MMITVTIFRTVLETDYSGEHSVTRTEAREVAIQLPEGSEPLWDSPSSYRIYGDWRVVTPPVGMPT